MFETELARAADHTYCHNDPGVNQTRELRHLFKELEQRGQRHIHEASETRLYSPSLSTLPIMCPSSGQELATVEKSDMANGIQTHDLPTRILRLCKLGHRARRSTVG